MFYLECPNYYNIAKYTWHLSKVIYIHLSKSMTGRQWIRLDPETKMNNTYADARQTDRE